MPKSVWTEGENPVRLTVGEVWKIKIPSVQRIMKCEILELGHKTVTFMETPFSHLKHVYDRGHVAFIEREDDDAEQE